MSALAIIQPDTLTIYYTDKNAIGTTLPPSVIADMEIVSEEELTAAVAKMLGTTTAGSTQTVLVVSDKFCFSLPVGEKDEEEVEKRLSSLTPFAHVATTNLLAQKQKYLLATNQDLYESVARALGDRGHQVVMVLSWLHLVHAGITTGALDQSVVKRVFDSMGLLRPFAFPFTSEPAPEPAKPKAASTFVKPPAKIPMGWIIFGAVALLYAIIMLFVFARGGS